MKKINLLFVLILAAFQLSAQVKVGDATLPNTVNFNEETLTINGAGMREKFFFDIYAGGLYLKAKSKDPVKIAEADETMAIKLHIVSSMISKDKLENALREGFDKATNGKIGAISERIETFLGFMNEEIQVGQVYDIVYEKGKGSVVYKDGKEKGYVGGLDFKKALFNIWIGEKPADKGLKNELLSAF